MAEKLTKASSLKGKDDKSAQSKKGRKVQIDFEDSLRPISPTPTSNGKVNPSVSSGDLGKSGKGGKAARGDKNSTVKVPVQELKIDGELPKKTKCLMDCEAADILLGIQERMVVLSADPAIKIPIGLMYAKRRGIPPDVQAVRRILEPLKKNGVSESEICMVANLKVTGDDEFFALFPSYKGKEGKLREPLTRAFGKLRT